MNREAPDREAAHPGDTISRNTMFASRDSFSYSDEELAEYERQENALSKSKRNKPRINLGDPNR